MSIKSQILEYLQQGNTATAQAPAAPAPEKTPDTAVPKSDEYGDIGRFGKDKDKAAGIMKQIKDIRAKLGEERFMSCLGGSGFSAVSEIIKISDLVSLYNALACELRSKENE